MFICVPLRDVITATASVRLTRLYRGNCYLYQTQGAYNTGMLDIVFYVTSIRHMLHHFLLRNVLKKLLGNAGAWEYEFFLRNYFNPLCMYTVEALFDAKRSRNTNCYSQYIQNCYLKLRGLLNWKFKCLFTIFWKF